MESTNQISEKAKKIIWKIRNKVQKFLKSN